LEKLETRRCLSVFFDVDVIASTHVGGPGSGWLELGNGPSINNLDHVAFQGKFTDPTGASTVENLFAFEPQNGQIVNLMDSFYELPNAGLTPYQTFGSNVQVNDLGQVLARRALMATGLGGNPVPLSYLESWPVTGSQAPTQTAMGKGVFLITPAITAPPWAASEPSAIDAFTPFRLVYGESGINNHGEVVFTGLMDTPEVLFTGPHNGDFRFLGTAISTGVRPQPMIADSGAFVVSNATAGECTTGGRVAVFPEYTFGVATILAGPADGFLCVGAFPAISDDGEVVVFAGDQGEGLGVYARVWEGTTFGPPIRVAGANTVTKHVELGVDGNAAAIYFQDFALDARGRLGVTHLSQDPVGADGDSFVVSFIGTPNQASRNNPRTQKPYFFSGEQGLWTIRVDVDKPSLFTDPDPLEYSLTSAFPVVQLGDQLGGGTITAIAVNDSIGSARRDLNGAYRTPVRGDHSVAFWAETTAGQVIAKATRNDTDQDGLLDHWERAGGGIDIDQDGAVDLDLFALGARPDQRDIFLEVDWLPIASEREFDSDGDGLVDSFYDKNKNNVLDQHRDFSPQVGALKRVEAKFQARNIHLHIDAGNKSVNYIGPRQGGDQITESATSSDHVDLVYFGTNSPTVPPGYVTRSMESIKQQYFGSLDKSARELAFHYAVFADESQNLSQRTGIAELGFQGPIEGAQDLNGNGVTDADYRNLSTIPGNDLVVSLLGIGQPSHLKIPLATLPSATTVAAPSGYLQSQTLMHELGHNLGLRHGGVDNVTTDPPPNHISKQYKPTYRSLMNYAYQFSPDTSGQLVDDYSDDGINGVHDDWTRLRLDFTSYLDALGNSFLVDRGASIDSLVETEEITIDDLVEWHGPFEPIAPDDAIPGDANLDHIFNSTDLVIVFQAGEYEDNQTGNSRWATGDWNRDGDFDTGDLVLAFQFGAYEQTARQQPLFTFWTATTLEQQRRRNRSDRLPDFRNLDQFDCVGHALVLQRPFN
jgi:hypothetical protein